MDAIKIIKKHGTPGGLPVVTVYVDADAPGEAQASEPLYVHEIQAGAMKAQVVTKDSTAYTMTTFVKWLQDNNHDATHSLVASGLDMSLVNSGTTIALVVPQRFYADSNDKLKVNATRMEYTLADGVFTRSQTTPTLDYTSYSLVDYVNILGE